MHLGGYERLYWPTVLSSTRTEKLDTDIRTNTYGTIQEKGRLGEGVKDYDSIEIFLGLDHPKIPRPTIWTKIVMALGNKEMAHVLTYVAISRAAGVGNIGIRGGLTFVRISSKHDDMKNESQKY